jgi:hypothetical protein
MKQSKVSRKGFVHFYLGFILQSTFPLIPLLSHPALRNKAGASHTCAKKTTHIITECIEINITITSEYLLHSGRLIAK